MGFLELAEKRHSIRDFTEQPVEEETLQKILAAANIAPSAGNLQAFKIAVVRDPGARKALSEAAMGQMFVSIAPVALVFFADLKRSSGRYGGKGRSLYAVQDATIACAYAQLAAEELGLSSVWVGAFGEKDVCRLLNAPRDLKPVAILPLGYAAELPFLTKRRGIQDCCVQEKFEKRLFLGGAKIQPLPHGRD